MILMGETRDVLAADVAASNVLENTLWSMAVVALLAVLAGLIAFRQITRPLRGLTRAMHELDVDRLAARRHRRTPKLSDERDEIAILRSAFRRMAARIAEQWRALRRQDQERRELIANVSHDLRTPLTSLHGFLETLAHKRDLSEAERERYLETALAQSSKVARLAHELFELARLEHDASSPDKEPFSLGDLVHDVVAGARPARGRETSAARGRRAGEPAACRGVPAADRPRADELARQRDPAHARGRQRS